MPVKLLLVFGALFAGGRHHDDPQASLISGLYRAETILQYNDLVLLGELQWDSPFEPGLYKHGGQPCCFIICSNA